MWQTIVAAAAVLVAIPGAGIGYAAFRRTAHVADVASTTAAQQVGLEYLTKSLEQQQSMIVHQEGLIGELRGALTSCKDERQILAEQIAELRRMVDP